MKVAKTKYIHRKKGHTRVPVVLYLANFEPTWLGHWDYRWFNVHRIDRQRVRITKTRKESLIHVGTIQTRSANRLEAPTGIHPIQLTCVDRDGRRQFAAGDEIR